MAWRDPIFCFENLLRAAASLTPTPAEDASYPVTRCYDDLLVPQFTHTSSGLNPQVSVDRGAGVEGSTPDRIILGPNWDHDAGVTLQVHEDNNSGYSSPTLLLTEVLGSLDETAPLALPFDSSSSDERYIRWRMTGTCTPAYREVWLTQDRVLTAGPDPSYSKYPIANLSEVETMSGTTWRVQRGASREFMQYTFNAVDETDIAIFDDLDTETSSGLYPFWFFPPDSNLAPIFVELVEDVQREQASAVPKGTGELWNVTITMRERIA